MWPKQCLPTILGRQATVWGVRLRSIAMTTVSGWGPLPTLVREMSGGPGLLRVLSCAGLPECTPNSPQSRIPLAKMVEVFGAAAREVGEDAFGLRVGSQTHLEAYGDWAGYCAGARTLGEGLQRVCGALWVHEAGSRMWLSKEPDHVVWRYSTGLPASNARRAFSDHLLKPMLDFPRSFLGLAWEPDWIELDYARPRHREALDFHFGRAVSYECNSVGVPIRMADLSAHSQIPDLMPRPITSVDLNRYRCRRKNNATEQIIELIDLCMMDGALCIDAVARLLDLGPRTFQRQLHQHGTGYRALLEEARRRKARALLLETERPIKAIAGDLGYGEPENFTRAFRAWFGISPSAFRAAVSHPHD